MIYRYLKEQFEIFLPKKTYTLYFWPIQCFMHAWATHTHTHARACIHAQKHTHSHISHIHRPCGSRTMTLHRQCTRPVGEPSLVLWEKPLRPGMPTMQQRWVKAACALLGSNQHCEISALWDKWGHCEINAPWDKCSKKWGIQTHHLHTGLPKTYMC